MRLGELYHSLQCTSNEKEGRVSWWVGTCTWSRAWPPFCQTDAELRPCDAARMRVDDLYRHCNVHDGYDLDLGVHDSHDIDISNIAGKVMNKDDIYLVKGGLWESERVTDLRGTFVVDIEIGRVTWQSGVPIPWVLLFILALAEGGSHRRVMDGHFTKTGVWDYFTEPRNKIVI